MPAKKYLRKKVEKLCLKAEKLGSKVMLSGILTEPSNPREGYPCESSYGETLEIMLSVPLNMGINNYREIFSYLYN